MLSRRGEATKWVRQAERDLATARRDGKAEGLREAAALVDERKRRTSPKASIVLQALSDRLVALATRAEGER